MIHLELGLSESAALDPTHCEVWLTRLENQLGFDLDGNQDVDGFSLDFAVDLFDQNNSIEQAARAIGKSISEVN